MLFKFTSSSVVNPAVRPARARKYEQINNAHNTKTAGFAVRKFIFSVEPWAR
jgi:hypothetical protein